MILTSIKMIFTPKLLRNTTILIFILLIFKITYSQSRQDNPVVWTGITSDTPMESRIKLVSSDITTNRIEIITEGFLKEIIRDNEGGKEVVVSAENTTPLLIEGAPDLGKLSIPLAIPDLDRMTVTVVEADYIDFQNILVIPSKGNLTRDINPDDVPYTYGREYRTDAFFPGVAAELRTPHIIRDVRAQVVVAYPFRYNPVSNVLRVYTRLVLDIASAGEDGENPYVLRREDDKTVRSFEEIYQRKLLNYKEYRTASRYTPLEEDGNMLIICYGSFMADMQPFVDWKNMSGIPTELVNVSSVGTTAAAIKSYVANYYNTNGLTYLLLVGDAAQVPVSSTTAGPSDNDYGYIVGSDHYPDIFVGRFSAETNAHVQTQVQRTLNYEKQPDLSPGFFERAMGIASAEGPGDDGEYDWQHQRNIRTDYMGFTYTYGAELYDGSQGGQDAAGNPTATMVASEINTGTGIISYTGHGSNTSWSTTGFSNTNITSLTNTNKLPFILSVACVNGNFAGITCFAEAWLRATYNNQPSGAVATIMSTINQSWNPPMQGQDEMVDILVENFPSNIKRTFGGICMNGCMGMNDVYGSAGADMTDTWTIFGDPSLMVRTAAPVTMAVDHPADLPVGSDEITVLCDQEGARVAVSRDFELLGTGYVSGGTALVEFGQINTEDTLIVTVTAFNCMPYIDTVFVTNAEMVYVSGQAFHGNLTEVAPGQQDMEALGVKILMSGSVNPFNLLSLTFNMNGTTNLEDVESLAVYYTGNNGSFGTATLFGTGVVSAGSITVTGNQPLNGGFNYFWLAYDLAEDALMGHFLDAECTGMALGDNPALTRVPAITDPDGQREINRMSLVSLTCTQPVTSPVPPGTVNCEIIRLEITTDGSPLPLTVTGIKVATQECTDLDDISAIKVYYTDLPAFSTTNLFGSVAPASVVTVTGNRALTEGTDYFWIVYDISASAGPGNELDAECTEVTFSGATGTQVPLVTDPPGYRSIMLNYCTPSYSSGSGYGDYISLVSMGTLSKATGASSSPYYNYYQDETTHLVPGSTYQLTLSPGTYGSGNNMAAWIDYNRNGTFESSEKLGELTNMSPTPATGTMTFTVPGAAIQGILRLRVREVWSTTGLDPCAGYSYGETEDYDVHIMPPGCWLGYTNEWTNVSNWSDGVVPGPGTEVIIPEILMGSYYPSVFGNSDLEIEQLNMQEGSNLSIPVGVTITVGGNRK